MGAQRGYVGNIGRDLGIRGDDTWVNEGYIGIYVAAVNDKLAHSSCQVEENTGDLLVVMPAFANLVPIQYVINPQHCDYSKKSRDYSRTLPGYNFLGFSQLSPHLGYYSNVRPL